MRLMAFSASEVCGIDERIAQAAHYNPQQPDYDDALIAECAAMSEADHHFERCQGVPRLPRPQHDP